MGRRGSNYTEVGKKITELAKNQELSKVLGLTQQSISAKLTGKISVTLKDLELLSRYFDIPIMYFVTGPEVTPGLARTWDKIMKEGSPELLQSIEVAATFPREFAMQLFATVKAMRATVSYYSHELSQQAGE